MNPDIQLHLRDFLEDENIKMYSANSFFIDAGKPLMDGSLHLLLRFRIGTNANKIHGITECLIGIRETDDTNKTKNGMRSRPIMYEITEKAKLFQLCATYIKGSDILYDTTLQNDSTASLKSMCEIISGHCKKILPVLVKIKMRERTL